MINTRLVLPVLAVLAAPMAFAQEATTSQETDTTEAPAQEDSVLDTGEPVQPTPPQTYIKTEHGDWDMQCLRVEQGEEPCQMYQLLKDPNGANVAEVSLFRVKDGGQVAAGGTFVVPLETLLTSKLTMSVDGGAAKRYDFAFCTPVGCYSRVGFTEEDIARFRAGASAQISIVPALAPEQTVTVTMSLSGFTAAYAEVSELSQ